MNIGEAAALSGLPAKTIRYYEEIGLVRPQRQAGNAYRAFSEQDVHVLRFLKRARGLGFSVEECRELLSLYRDRNRASADVKAIATARIDAIEEKIAALQSLKETLSVLAVRCQGDERPDCPILDDLAGDAAGGRGSIDSPKARP